MNAKEARRLTDAKLTVKREWAAGEGGRRVLERILAQIETRAKAGEHTYSFGELTQDQVLTEEISRRLVNLGFKVVSRGMMSTYAEW